MLGLTYNYTFQTAATSVDHRCPHIFKVNAIASVISRNIQEHPYYSRIFPLSPYCCRCLPSTPVFQPLPSYHDKPTANINNLVYDIVFCLDTPRVTQLIDKVEHRKWLDQTLADPIVRILLHNSNITMAQLETLLLDNIADAAPDLVLNYEQKARLRSPPVTRGAFGRTLSQARYNIRASVYTMLLLSYIGIVEGPFFDQYRTLAEDLIHYKSFLQPNPPSDPTFLRTLSHLQRTLADNITSLSTPRTTKTRPTPV